MNCRFDFPVSGKALHRPLFQKNRAEEGGGRERGIERVSGSLSLSLELWPVFDLVTWLHCKLSHLSLIAEMAESMTVIAVCYSQSRAHI